MGLYLRSIRLITPRTPSRVRKPQQRPSNSTTKCGIALDIGGQGIQNAALSGDPVVDQHRVHLVR